MHAPQDERLTKFDSHVSELLRAIHLCLGNDCVIPSMMLLYAAADGMAWLYKDHDANNNGRDFREWVDKFWLVERRSGQAGGISSGDLWSARIALLHEQTSNSGYTRSGKTLPLIYFSGKGRMDIPSGGEWNQKQPVGVRAEDMVTAFTMAVDRFREFILQSPRRERILSRCTEWFDQIRPHGYFKCN